MRISIDKNIVEFMPENNTEKAEFEALWKMLIDCNGTALKLTPVGEYNPNKNDKSAAFYIEGLDASNKPPVSIVVQEDCTVWCRTCNKLVNLKKGDAIPVCCGKVMEIVD
ncbi:MAG: hypothetical protein FWD71_08335 [Oscillospiraceae bacterium]|nr:hypothetical protein [Oscillospiraceae bacterium]